MPTLTFPNLKAEYQQLFDSCQIKPARQTEVDNIIAVFHLHRDRYRQVEAATKVPARFVFLVHHMESNNNFRTHLHNGDSLIRRTTRVPSGRPKKGEPPFTWEESAIDCLEYMRLDKWDWAFNGVPGELFCLETYNGFGYRRHGINSPYLYSGSNHYTCGKYVADGKWDCNAVSQQIGAAVILKEMVKQNASAVSAAIQGGRAAFQVVENTFLKQKPVQSSLLDAREKVAIAAGKQLRVLAYKIEGDHYRITFDTQVDGFNTWMIYAPHIQLA